VASLRLVGHAEHWIGFSFDHRHRDLLTLFVEDLGHAQLFANDANHCL
jgi:hypothetical protein